MEHRSAPRSTSSPRRNFLRTQKEEDAQVELAKYSRRLYRFSNRGPFCIPLGVGLANVFIAKKIESGDTRQSIPTLVDLGISHDQASNWQRLAVIPKEQFGVVFGGTTWCFVVQRGAPCARMVSNDASWFATDA
jgi:hypothetical protein